MPNFKPALVVSLLALGLAACSSSSTGGTGGGSGGGSGGGTGGGTTGGYTCSSATLFAGSPLNDMPMSRPAEGTALLADPPFPYRTIVFSAGQLITHSGQEIWRASLSDSKLHKIAGLESVSQSLITGACADARFGNIFGIALGSDGSLYVSDQTANAILKVTNPLAANCTVSHYAGTPTDQAVGTFNPNSPPNVGNVEGAGAVAKFKLPERLAIDPADNLYVWDNGNDSIRKIASDANHTVSTIAKAISGGAGSLVAEVFLGGKLYVWGLASTDLFLTAVDPATSTKTDVLRGRADKFGGNSSDSHVMGGIVTDGTALIVFYNGQFFRITTAGAISDPLAGKYHIGADYSGSYDPKVSHNAATLEIPDSNSATATAGAESWLAIDSAHNLYFTGQKLNRYVLKLSCAP